MNSNGNLVRLAFDHRRLEIWQEELEADQTTTPNTLPLDVAIFPFLFGPSPRSLFSTAEASTTTSVATTDSSTTAFSSTSDSTTTETTATTITTTATKTTTSTTTTTSTAPFDQHVLKKWLEELEADNKTVPQTLPFYLAFVPKENRSELSWEQDDLFQWASFEGQELELQKDIVKWNEATLGNCFTFNHMSKPAKFHLQVPGRKEGFRALMRVYQDQYLHWIEDAALLVFVHSSNQAVLGESLRFLAKPGTHTTLAITQTKFERLGGKYGECVYDKEEVNSYYFEGDYSIDGCFRSCYQDALYKTCGCMDPRFPRPEEDTPGCDMSKRQCVFDMSKKSSNPSTWKECSCPLPCSNMQFTAQWSSADFTLKQTECSKHKHDNRTYQNCLAVTDHVLISVYMENFLFQTLKEQPKTDFNKFISDLGGLLGILCGITFITFVEFLLLVAPGRKEGFRALMRVYQDQYLHWVEDAALLVFVHSSSQAPALRFFAKLGHPRNSRYHSVKILFEALFTLPIYTELESLGGIYVRQHRRLFPELLSKLIYKACGCMYPKFLRIEDKYPGCDTSESKTHFLQGNIPKCNTQIGLKTGEHVDLKVRERALERLEKPAAQQPSTSCKVRLVRGLNMEASFWLLRLKQSVVLGPET
ncbi:hypothetical protein L596_010359 [Steinernema carpocapsae]|uniref:Uncharacterized protein n=1 Tax=Steinernema carpocapsae TaxID=34508 RepID=A0A4U5PJF9_STECR|nr:hypothetical protein L596_010359 [Steinernema carpocapsae]